MAVAGVRKTVIEVVNDVERKLSLTASTSLAATQFTPVMLQNLNEVVTDLSDAGEWKETYAEASVAVSGGVHDYPVTASGDSLVQSIFEVAYTDRIAPLIEIETSDINRLTRLSANGTPNQYSVVSVDASANPVIRVYPAPTTAAEGSAAFTVSYYKKPPIYTDSDADTTIPFPANVVVQGLYAKALLEENGGEPTREYQAQLALYERAKNEAMNRYTSDTGHEIRFKPRRGRR